MHNVKPKLRKIDMKLTKNFVTGKYMGKFNPTWIDFRITSACNLRCVYCDIPNNPIPEMNTDTVKKVIDKIKDIGRWILLTGGEPLVRKDIGEVIDYFVFNTDMNVMLNSNLILLPQKYDQVKNADGFYFSLDGTKETHNKNKGDKSYEGMMEGLKILHSEKRGKISMTVLTDATTMDDVKSVLDVCSDYDITPAFQLVRHYDMSASSEEHAAETERSVEMFQYLIDQRKNGYVMMNSVKGLEAQQELARERLALPCYSGRLFCTVDADGEVGLCFSRPRNKTYKNIAEDDVTFKDALKSLQDVKPHTNRCMGCSCMAPMEFALFSLLNTDVIKHNNESFNRLFERENAWVDRQKTEYALSDSK